MYGSPDGPRSEKTERKYKYSAKIKVMRRRVRNIVSSDALRFIFLIMIINFLGQSSASVLIRKHLADISDH